VSPEQLDEVVNRDDVVIRYISHGYFS